MSTHTLAAPSARTEDAAPRGRVLMGLGVGVLLVHLSLLSGGFSGFSLDMFVAPDAELSSADAPPPPSTPSAATEAEPLPEIPEPVRVSRVRWIVPKAPEPEPVPEPPPKVVKTPPPPKPEPKPEVIEPEVVVEAPPTELALAIPPEPVPDPPPPAPVEVPVAPAPPVSDVKPGTEVADGTVQGAGVGLSEAGLPPAVVPPSVQLKYAVKALSKGSTYHGSGRLDWSHDGQQYQARLTAKVLFFNVFGQTSEGRLSDKGLAPDRFTDNRRSERAAHFERSAAKIRYSNNAPDAVLLPGAQDRLSVNLQLAALFNARPDAYAEGQTLRLPVSSHDMSEVWLFRVGPQSTERLPAGEVAARKLTRSPRKEFDRTVELWLGPTIAHLPVRLRITEPSGDFVDMTLEELPVFAVPPASATVN
jgi:outer membrane biosynthesis protein TonB